LAEIEKYDPLRALAILDEIRALFVGRDPDGWVDRSLRTAWSHVLMQNQRYEEAVAQLRSLALEPDLDPEERLVNQTWLAISLEKLGQPGEALAEIDSTIALGPSINPARLFPLLVLYAKIAEKIQRTIPESYAPVFLSAARSLGIDTATALDGRTVHQSVLDAARQMRGSRSTR
jgi:tetratricopeptide (TPR) repeat protein